MRILPFFVEANDLIFSITLFLGAFFLSSFVFCSFTGFVSFVAATSSLTGAAAFCAVVLDSLAVSDFFAAVFFSSAGFAFSAVLFVVALGAAGFDFAEDAAAAVFFSVAALDFVSVLEASEVDLAVFLDFLLRLFQIEFFALSPIFKILH